MDQQSLNVAECSQPFSSSSLSIKCWRSANKACLAWGSQLKQTLHCYFLLWKVPQNQTIHFCIIFIFSRRFSVVCFGKLVTASRSICLRRKREVQFYTPKYVTFEFILLFTFLSKLLGWGRRQLMVFQSRVKQKLLLYIWITKIVHVWITPSQETDPGWNYAVLVRFGFVIRSNDNGTIWVMQDK